MQISVTQLETNEAHHAIAAQKHHETICAVSDLGTPGQHPARCFPVESAFGYWGYATYTDMQLCSQQS